jgi:Co/Zn/Cd efflux system component
MDPAMGVVGGLLVARWSWGLLRSTSRVLLDRQAPDSVLESLRRAIAGDSVRIRDLHVWEIGPGYRAAIVSVESETALTPHAVKEMFPQDLGISHFTVEVEPAKSRGDGSGSAKGDR